jgi:acyl CoA:acetate/3-ketoacid CoA transferase alpha subunit
MNITEQGQGEIFSKITPNEFREHMRIKAERGNSDKRMNLKEAIARFVKSDDYLSIGGCSIVRIPMAFIHEVLRQGLHFRMAAGTRTYDVDLLLDNDRISEIDIGYILGLEMLGLPLYTRTRMKEKMNKKELKICEWSNGTMAWRHKAGAMGVSFLPVRSLAGTDTFKYSAAKKIKCPFTGMDVVLVPALYSDIAVIHVHRADKHGNCQIDGMLNEDLDKARSAKNLIITTEKIIDTEEIRNDGSKTVIPQFYVDAVVEMPYGAYPTNMPGLYYMDLDHLREYAKVTEDRSGKAVQNYYAEYIYGTNNFNEFLKKCGGQKRLDELRRIELMEERSDEIENTELIERRA